MSEFKRHTEILNANVVH